MQRSSMQRPNDPLRVKGFVIMPYSICRQIIHFFFNEHRPPRWSSGKAFASRAEGPGFESRLRRDFFPG